ncbi:hypothetical protein VTI28DRAFT_3527 [Corynascus sepedonium]
MNLDTATPEATTEALTTNLTPVPADPAITTSENIPSKPADAVLRSSTPSKTVIRTIPPITETPPTPSEEVTACLIKATTTINIDPASTTKMGHKTRKGVLYVTSFFVPPLAVYMRRGTNRDFGLNILLTLLGWIPGVLHAMYLVSK